MKENMYYVVVDIGCIECGEPSEVIGIYKDAKKAEKMLREIEKIYDDADENGKVHGRHDFAMFEQKFEKPYYPYYAEEN